MSFAKVLLKYVNIWVHMCAYGHICVHMCKCANVCICADMCIWLKPSTLNPICFVVYVFYIHVVRLVQ